MNLYNMTCSIEDLIFDGRLARRLPVPLKVKFGRLGQLRVSIPNVLNVAKDGLKIHISDVFLCFEMLEVQDWSEETVISKFQANKKHDLKVF